MLPSARLCLSWSGFREADSYVRSDHLYISVDLRYFTDGDSSLYDGTPLVGQSVARVRTSSHSKKVLHLMVNVPSREPRSFLCLSTTVLDLLAFLKDPRLRSEVLSTSACATNGLPFSGSRTTLHNLVEIPARYSTRLRPLFIAGMMPQTLIGYSHWTNCWSDVHLLSLPERGLFYCCPSCCMRLPLTRRRGASSHNDPFYRSSNRERHSLFPTLTPNVMPPLGCSSRTTYHPVSQHQ